MDSGLVCCTVWGFLVRWSWSSCAAAVVGLGFPGVWRLGLVGLLGAWFRSVLCDLVVCPNLLVFDFGLV